MTQKTGFSEALLAWYDKHQRRLPWRALPGKAADPYRVWLSEIMLQQTVVATVKPYFEKFTQRWPTLQELARAPLDDVLAAWAGLGYYSRARNLHACAQAVAASGGVFPVASRDLLALPGIGSYTAAAIAAIAHGEPATVVDGNVERVVARIFRVEIPLPLAKPELKALAARLTPQDRKAGRAGDYAQAMMDLGATVCVPRSPKCIICPVADHCEARMAGIQNELPRRAPRQARPSRRGIAYWTVCPTQAGDKILLRKRPAKGLLGGMIEVPSSPWAPAGLAGTPGLPGLPGLPDLPVIGSGAPVAADWQETGRSISHVFTHFALELEIVTATLRAAPILAAPYLWATIDEMEPLALPSVMRKIVAAMSGETGKKAGRGA